MAVQRSEKTNQVKIDPSVPSDLRRIALNLLDAVVALDAFATLAERVGVPSDKEGVEQVRDAVQAFSEEWIVPEHWPNFTTLIDEMARLIREVSLAR